MAVFYIAERLCYRVAFLLSGVCNRHLLAVADYWRAKRERWHTFVRDCEKKGTNCLPGKKPVVAVTLARSPGRERFLDIPSRFAVSRRVRRDGASVPL